MEKTPANAIHAHMRSTLLCSCFSQRRNAEFKDGVSCTKGNNQIYLKMVPTITLKILFFFPKKSVHILASIICPIRFIKLAFIFSGMA